MREEIIKFGVEKNLVGVANIPQQIRPNCAPILFLNAGIVHRVGPHRLHVKIARHLSNELGIPSFRFDLGGLGDSRPAPSDVGQQERFIQETRAAIDAFKTLLNNQYNSYTLFGLCSGADTAYKVALADQRVTHLVLLDAYAYDSPKAKRDRLISKCLDPKRWARPVTRLFQQKSGTDRVEFSLGRSFPPKSEYAHELSELTHRGVNILSIYSQFVSEQMTHTEHFWSAFPDTNFVGRLVVDVDMSVDHTYSTLMAQEKLKGKLLNWSKEQFGE